VTASSGSDPGPPGADPGPGAPPAAQLTLDLLPPAPPTLDNFVTGRNAEALAALRAVAAGSGAQFVHLWGAPGSGRSHLLHALVPLAPDRHRVATFEPARTLYVVDDVEMLGSDDQAALFGLQNEVRGRPGARLVTAGSAPPAMLALRDDVRTRLAWGLVYRVEPLHDADKAVALAAHLRARGILPAEDLIPHLLAHRPRDLRALIALLDALDAYALSLQRPLTVPLLRQWEAARARRTVNPGAVDALQHRPSEAGGPAGGAGT
jgi:DnaA family protein